jgi:hypothetical protein
MQELNLMEVEAVSGALAPFAVWLAIDLAIWGYNAYQLSK